MGYQTWLVAIYLLNTTLKGVSSMKLHRDLSISQKSARHLAHRLREGWRPKPVFQGPFEVDETYIAEKRRTSTRPSDSTGAGAGLESPPQ